MSRALYGLLVHLHPRGFRDRFEDEMLAVYDDAVASRGGLRLVASALVSLIGQWLRPSPSNGIAVSADTMRAYGICMERQRLEIVATLVAIGGWVVFHLLFVDATFGHLVLAMSFAAFWGSCELAPAIWRRVRSPQEYERARRPGLRDELERKARKMWTNRVLVWIAWLCMGLLVVQVVVLLRYPEWRRWDGPPGGMIFLSSGAIFQSWLQRRLAQALRREIDAVAPLADDSTG